MIYLRDSFSHLLKLVTILFQASFSHCLGKGGLLQQFNLDPDEYIPSHVTAKWPKSEG